MVDCCASQRLVSGAGLQSAERSHNRKLESFENQSFRRSLPVKRKDGAWAEAMERPVRRAKLRRAAKCSGRLRNNTRASSHAAAPALGRPPWAECSSGSFEEIEPGQSDTKDSEPRGARSVQPADLSPCSSEQRQRKVPGRTHELRPVTDGSGTSFFAAFVRPAHGHQFPHHGAHGSGQ